jgi:hypothetical protein
MKIKEITGYRISRGYARLTIWSFDATTKQYIGHYTLTPDKKMPRKLKYKTIVEDLKEWKIKAPAYKPAKNEKVT